MVFSFLPRKSEQDKSLALLIDIGSSSVGAALVRIEKGRPPHFLLTVREDIPFQEVLSSGGFLRGMNRALSRTLARVRGEAKTKGIPAQVFCTLSSPWFMLKSRHLVVAQEKAFVVTPDTLDGFIKEDLERLKEELKETLPANDLYVLEKKIVRMKLNGYDIKKPYGQTTTRMEIDFTISVSSQKAIRNIERTISSFFGPRTVHFGAFPVAAFSVIRDIFPAEQHFLFLDVTGEATDVSSIERDLLSGTASFPRGKNFFIREISAAFRTPHHEAGTLFNMYLAKTLDAKTAGRMAGVIARAEEEWIVRFKKALSLSASEGASPRMVFFTVDPELKEIFTRLIVLAHGHELEVRSIDHFVVAQFVSFEPEVLRDSFLVIESLLATKTLNAHNG